MSNKNRTTTTRDSFRQEDITFRPEPRFVPQERGFEALEKEYIQLFNNKFKGIDNVFVSEEVFLPLRGTSKSAGYDFISHSDITIEPGEKITIWSNVKVYMNDDEVFVLHMRSSLGIKKDLVLANTTGIIDSDYYLNKETGGNIGICIKNYSKNIVNIKKGDRIVQGVFQNFLVSDNCNSTQVRNGGFGSTGE